MDYRMTIFICLTIAILCIIYILCSLAAGPSNPKAKMTEEDKAKMYESFFEKLPEDLNNKYANLMVKTARLSGISMADLPEILFTTAKAVGNVIENKAFGTITPEQHSKIKELLAGYSKYVLDVLIPSSNTVMSNSSSKGLDFGIITNNVADVALYNMMDAQEKRRNNNKHIYEYSKMIEKEIYNLLNGITEILS